MTTKRIGKWVIVLFLLAALPGMTAVMAQGQEPAGVTAPTAEIGESPVTIPYASTESEPNNTMAQADEINLVMSQSSVQGGAMPNADSYDYWKIEVDDDSYIDERATILINMDSQSFGSGLRARLCLYSDDNIELACNHPATPSANWGDGLLYYNVETFRSYYLRVEGIRNTPADYRYQLLVSQPLIISAAAAGLKNAKVDTIPIQAGDVLAWSRFGVSGVTYEKWVMLLDLSDLGTTVNLTNLSAGWRNSDYLLVNFAAQATLPGAGVVSPFEVVIFDPTELGPNTQGTFMRWWDGRNHALTTSTEKIDALDWCKQSTATHLYISTSGTATVPSASSPKLRLPDEDVGLWSLTTNQWARAFDGTHPVTNLDRDVDWRLGARDVVAFGCGSADTSDIYHTYYWDFLVLNGTGEIAWGYVDNEPTTTRNVNQKQILNFFWDDSDLDMEYHFNVGVAWNGPDHKWNYNIDAFGGW